MQSTLILSTKSRLYFNQYSICPISTYHFSLNKCPMGNVANILIVAFWTVGWMDFLRFYALFNSVLVISGRWAGDNERLCAMELRLWLRFRFEPGPELGTARSVVQRLTY